MALPVVTAKQYDYGQYASPTMVKYKGGQQAIGAAIGKTIEAGVEAYTQKKQEEKIKDVKETTTTSQTIIKLYDTFGADIAKLSANNELEAKNLLNEIGTLEGKNIVGRISQEEYTEKRIKKNEEFQSLLLLGKVKDVADAGVIIQQDYRQENFDRNAGFNSAIATDNYELYRKEGELMIRWNGVLDNSETGKKDVYEKSLKEVMYNNSEYLKLQEKFKFESGKAFEDLKNGVQLFDRNSEELFQKTITNKSGTYAYLDEEKAKNSLLNPNSQYSIIVDKYIEVHGKDMFEDLVKTREDYENEEYNSPEVQNILKEKVAEQIIKLANKKGDKVPQSKTEVAVEGPIYDTNYLQSNVDDTFYNLKSAVYSGTGQEGAYDPLKGVFSYQTLDEASGKPIVKTVNFKNEPTRAQVAFGEIFDNVYAKNYPPTERYNARRDYIRFSMDKIKEDINTANKQLQEQTAQQQIIGPKKENEQQKLSIRDQILNITSYKANQEIPVKEKKKMISAVQKRILTELAKQKLDVTYANYDRMAKFLDVDNKVTFQDKFFGTIEPDRTVSDEGLLAVNLD